MTEQRIDTASEVRTEQRALRLSASASAVIGGVAVVWGLACSPKPCCSTASMP